MAKKSKKDGQVVLVAEPEVVAVTPAAAEASAEEREFLLAKEDYEYLLARAARIAKQILGSLGNTLRLEQDGAVPEAERLQRNADGTVAREEIDRLINSWEAANGGEGSAANLLSREAHKFYMDGKLFNVIGYRELVEIVGKFWGVTLDELKAALEQKQKDEAAYQALLDRRDDGKQVVCDKDASAGVERVFQPVSSFQVKDGKRKTFPGGKEIPEGNFCLLKDKTTGKLRLHAFCHACKKQYKAHEWELNKELREKGERPVYLNFMPRSDAEALLERIEKGQKQTTARSSFDDEAFAAEKARRDRQSRGRSPWGNKPRDDRGRSQRDQRRSGSGPYRGRDEE